MGHMELNSDPTRRTFLLDPGESPVLSRSILETISRWNTFRAASGLSDVDFHVTPLVAVPVPIYPSAWPAGHKRWVGTRASFMWNPLMWLPAPLRSHFVSEDGSYREDHTLWALRIVCALTGSGFYDQTTGEWLDVLSLHNLDISDPEVEARVQKWLDGGSDEVLDNIDLSNQIVMDQVQLWQEVGSDYPVLQGMQWASTAMDFGADDTGLIAQLRADIIAKAVTMQRVAANTSTMCWMGQEFLADALDEETTAEVIPGGWTELLRRARELQNQEKTTGGDISRVLDYAGELTDRIARTYMPVLEAAEASDNSTEGIGSL